MAKNQYPDECPVFRYKGQDFVGRPEWVDPALMTFGPGIVLVAAEGYGMTTSPNDDFPMHFSSLATLDGFEPLTRAAEELLAWVRQ